MRIAQYVCVYPPYKGGIGKVASDFKKYLDKQGVNSEVYTPLYAKNIEKKVGVHRLKTILKFGNAAFLPQLLYEVKKIDVLLIHYPFFGVAEFIWLAKIVNPKLKIIIHYHMDPILNSPILKLLSLPNYLTKKFLFKNADLVTCASVDYVKTSSIKKIYEKNHNKFVEIPFAVNTERFRPHAENLYSRMVLFVGGLDKAHYFKGVDILIDSFKIVLQKKQHAKLRIVGEGNLKTQYIKKVKELGIDESVQFLGNINNERLAEEYAQASMLVLPSINNAEAFGIVLIEAMSCGVPVIASRLPGVRKVFEDTVQGFQVEASNSEQLASKIIQIMSDSDLRSNMSKNARKLTMSKYDEKVISKKFVKTIIDLYENLPN